MCVLNRLRWFTCCRTCWSVRVLVVGGGWCCSIEIKAGGVTCTRCGGQGEDAIIIPGSLVHLHPVRQEPPPTQDPDPISSSQSSVHHRPAQTSNFPHKWIPFTEACKHIVKLSCICCVFRGGSRFTRVLVLFLSISISCYLTIFERDIFTF